MTPSTDWPRCPSAEAFTSGLLVGFRISNPAADSMAESMLKHAGVLMAHIIDHWRMPDDPENRLALTEAGYVERLTCDAEPVWICPGARLPRIRLVGGLEQCSPVLAVESISDFEEAWNLPNVGRNGDTDSGCETAFYPMNAAELGVVVRIGYNGFKAGDLSATYLREIERMRRAIRGRPRPAEGVKAIEQTFAIMQGIVEELGAPRAADEFFMAEREYYMSRCSAARTQYLLQQDLGIGWANHDHHTYRSSRKGFRPLLKLWELLGFERRERYYAGSEAGWGAQIVEHPVSRVVIFSDVDLAPDELDLDFASIPLAPRKELGTIGLWCGLHGDSIGSAGMHHIECEYDYRTVRKTLNREGVDVMNPFTDLPILKQAFTVGEVWQVDPERVNALLQAGSITGDQAERFLSQGATGSHLEILQRWEGFKGFNKTGVSAIIKATDARGGAN